MHPGGAQDSLYVTDDFLVTHNTLNDSFIILDEAQNTTPEQMKMFLTRIGFGSKAVINGDSTQIDLASGQTSGLSVIQEILDGHRRDRVRATSVAGTWYGTRSCRTSWRPTDRFGAAASGVQTVTDDDGGHPPPSILVSDRRTRPLDQAR